MKLMNLHLRRQLSMKIDDRGEIRGSLVFLRIMRLHGLERVYTNRM